MSENESEETLKDCALELAKTIQQKFNETNEKVSFLTEVINQLEAERDLNEPKERVEKLSELGNVIIR